MDRNFEYELEPEVERDVEVQEKVVGKYKLNQYEIIYLHLLQKKYENDSRRLEVFVDEIKNKYYITVFAASELGLINYEVACREDDNGRRLYEISPRQLEILKEVFKDRIVYRIISEKEKETNELDDFEDDFNDFDDVFIHNDVKNEVFDNSIVGNDIGLLYNECKSNGDMETFERYIKNTDIRNLFSKSDFDKDNYNKFKK